MKRTIVLTLISCFSSIIISAQSSPIFIKDNKAIRGYDPVAYFTEGKPVEGKADFVYKWNNADWYFSSQKNLDAFKADPTKFAPQYGGYCAYGLSGGYKAPTEADAWTIFNGKLYLNYNIQVRELWSKNKGERIKTADTNWTDLKDK